MNQKTIVLSVDSLVGEDLDRMKSMPNFVRLFQNAARVNEIHGIYPSLTYPAHVTMMTGCRPGKHGLFTNDEMSLTGGPVRWSTESSGMSPITWNPGMSWWSTRPA